MSSTPATPVPIRIDFVSDVSCPWCVIGLKALEQALAKLDGTVQAEIHFQPFELNANMPAEGEDIGEHIARKYGSTPEQMAQSREAIRASSSWSASSSSVTSSDSVTTWGWVTSTGSSADRAACSSSTRAADSRNPDEPKICEPM